jgi:hypothetical protein
MRSGLRLSALAAALLMGACSAGPVEQPSAVAGASPQVKATTPAKASTTVTIMGAGDIAGDAETAGATSDLIRAADPSFVFTTGDSAYPDGARSDYAARYDPTWGAFKDRTHPVPGNHDYRTEGAAGYVEYFGADRVTNTVDGGLYYAWDVGNGWRAYAVNTEISTSGAQLDWLEDDVAAHPDQNYILYGHRPRFTSGTEHAPSDSICPLWNALASTGGLEVVLAGHNHQYERFAPMDCAGRASDNGARSFVVGSGGKALYSFGPAASGSEFRDNSHFGVLKLALYETTYEWEFLASGVGQNGSATVATNNAGEVLDKGAADV